VTARETADDLLRLLTQVAGGSAELRIDGAPFVAFDGNGRNVTVQMRSVLAGGTGIRGLLREDHVHLWQVRGVPSALARSGWNVSIRDGPDEVVRMGRDASALTGHVHVSARALLKLGRAR
jgi:hypothetical protein